MARACARAGPRSPRTLRIPISLPDDVRVSKQVVQEGLHVVQGVGAAQVQEEHAHAVRAHAPASPTALRAARLRLLLLLLLLAVRGAGGLVREAADGGWVWRGGGQPCARATHTGAGMPCSRHRPGRRGAGAHA